MGEKDLQERPIRHHSFILTLWQEADSPPIWRFRLENPLTSERHGFKEMAELVQFLGEWTAVSPKESPIEE